MKFLFDLFPIILFFAVYKFFGVFAATAAAIGATVLQIIWVWFRHRKVDTMLWVSFGIIGVLGGATLYFQDETFIKWKPTALYWLFGITLIVSALVFKKNILRSLMAEQISLPDVIWARLNFSWAVFFSLLGCINLFVAYTYSTDTWVNFKLFGTMGLMLVFVLAQGLLISKYVDVDVSVNVEEKKE